MSGDDRAPGGSAPPERLTPQQLRERLYTTVQALGALDDPEIERAFRQVDRRIFLPEQPPEAAYADIAIATHYSERTAISSASQPSLVALMLGQLRLAPGMRVLEIGAGTGYNAALLAQIVGPEGSVTTIDLDAAITDTARAHLAAAGMQRVQVVTGDGAYGWPPTAPYDRIEMTVAVADIRPEWTTQLIEGGLLVVPVQFGQYDVSIAFRKHGSMLSSDSVIPCGFLGLRGVAAVPARTAYLDANRRLVGMRAAQIAPTVQALLEARPRLRLGLAFSSDFWQMLALADAGAVQLYTSPPLPPSPPSASQSASTASPPPHRARLRNGLYVDGPDGPSLALTATRMPLIFVFGGRAAEDKLLALEQRLRGVRMAEPTAWQLRAYPRDGAVPPPPPDAVRHARTYFVYDLLLPPPNTPPAAGARG